MSDRRIALDGSVPMARVPLPGDNDGCVADDPQGPFDVTVAANDAIAAPTPGSFGVGRAITYIVVVLSGLFIGAIAGLFVALYSGLLTISC